MKNSLTPYEDQLVKRVEEIKIKISTSNDEFELEALYEELESSEAQLDDYRTERVEYISLCYMEI